MKKGDGSVILGEYKNSESIFEGTLDLGFLGDVPGFDEFFVENLCNFEPNVINSSGKFTYEEKGKNPGSGKFAICRQGYGSFIKDGDGELYDDKANSFIKYDKDPKDSSKTVPIHYEKSFLELVAKYKK